MPQVRRSKRKRSTPTTYAEMDDDPDRDSEEYVIDETVQSSSDDKSIHEPRLRSPRPATYAKDRLAEQPGHMAPINMIRLPNNVPMAIEYASLKEVVAEYAKHDARTPARQAVDILNQHVLKDKFLTHDEWLAADIVLPLGTSQITQPLVAQMNITSLEAEVGRLVPHSKNSNKIIRMSEEQIHQNLITDKVGELFLLNEPSVDNIRLVYRLDEPFWDLLRNSHN